MPKRETAVVDPTVKISVKLDVGVSFAMPAHPDKTLRLALVDDSNQIIDTKVDLGDGIVLSIASAYEKFWLGQHEIIELECK